VGLNNSNVMVGYWANTNTAPADLDWQFESNYNYYALQTNESWPLPMGDYESYATTISNSHSIYGYFWVHSWQGPAQFGTNAPMTPTPGWAMWHCLCYTEARDSSELPRPIYRG
jgi:hypothetical protein